MDKLTRVNQKIFASEANITEVGVFGSEGEGTPTNSKDPLAIQSLGAFNAGWLGAILGPLNPTLEDRNGLDLLITYQLAYLLQMGVPEWNAATTYHEGSIINVGGVLYESLQDDNENHATTDSAWWSPQGRKIRTITLTSQVLLVSDDVVLFDTPDGMGLQFELPDVALAKGKKITIKNIGLGLLGGYPGNYGVTKIDGQDEIDISTPWQAVTLVSDGTNWFRV